MYFLGNLNLNRLKEMDSFFERCSGSYPQPRRISSFKSSRDLLFFNVFVEKTWRASCMSVNPTFALVKLSYQPQMKDNALKKKKHMAVQNRNVNGEEKCMSGKIECISIIFESFLMKKPKNVDE